MLRGIYMPSAFHTLDPEDRVRRRCLISSHREVKEFQELLDFVAQP
jgi:hypothetical protein